ncbi:MAG: hypothetical protein IKM43_03680 [Clostridia bacterium]|nr:hypothetical protein [Clostridia bacterium]
MFIERLTDEEIKEIVEPLIEKYNIRKYDPVFEIKKKEGCYEIVIARFTEYIEDTLVAYENICIMSDFAIYEDLYEEKETGCQKDYLKSMYDKFGEEYKKRFKVYLKRQKEAVLQDKAEELDEDITDVMESLR